MLSVGGEQSILESNGLPEKITGSVDRRFSVSVSRTYYSLLFFLHFHVQIGRCERPRVAKRPRP